MSGNDYTCTERVRRFRDRRRAAGQPDRDPEQARAYERTRQKATKPFMGVDGEGAGRDETGRQHYMLLRAGERELFTGSPLSTVECLEFLCDCEPDVILVAFAFGYDVAQILCDLPAERLTTLFADKPTGAGHSRYTYFRSYGIEYLPKNYFRVCRTQRIWRNGVEGRQSIAGTARTVYDTFGFFQMSFLKALKDWDVATKGQLAAIEKSKEHRGDADWHIGQTERDYCGLECDLLAAMMEKFRTVCYAADIRPRTWNGAGKLSAALHAAHDTLTAEQVRGLVPASDPARPDRPGVLAFANAGYYGGRFEVMRTGLIQAPDHFAYGPNPPFVYEHDIRSAYPAAMPRLPCLVHGGWQWGTPKALRAALDDPGALFVATLHFTHAGMVEAGRRANLYGLPVRQKSGRLCWPYEASGTYWSPEIRSAMLLGCRPKFRAGWIYQKRCDCKMFDWVDRLYEYRREIGSDVRGKPIKLGINGLYGKLAQRIGNPKYANLIWAGLITAMTRAQLNAAAATDPDAILMLATDALFSLRPLNVPISERLGDWEASAHERLFIVQPGIYWGGKKPKTRGVPASFFADKTDLFETAWQEFTRATKGGRVPTVALPVKLFIGPKLALARGKPETSRKWVSCARHPVDAGEIADPAAECTCRQFSFDWKAKRQPGIVWETPNRVWHFPPKGGPDMDSKPHNGADALVLEIDMQKAELDDQPDHFDIGIPFRDD